MEKLRVEFSGDASEIVDASKEGIKAIENFEDKVNGSLDNVEDKLGDAGKKVKELGDDIDDTSPSLKDFDKNTKSTSNSSKELAGGLGEAARGLGNVAGEAGGATQSILDIAFSFIGPQGLIVGIGAAVVGLVSYAEQVTRTNRDNQVLADKINEVSEILKEYESTIQGVTSARLSGEKSAQRELFTLGQLRNAAEDVSLSTGNRLKAVQELRRLYPNYFKDLTNEQILNGNVGKSYDALTGSILQRAKATAASNLLVKNAERELSINQRILAISGQINKNDSDRAEGFENGVSGLGGFAPLAAAIENGLDLIQNSRLESEAEDLVEELERILGENLDLTAFLNDNGGAIDFDALVGDISKAALAEAIPLDVQIEANPIVSTAQDFSENLKGKLIDPIEDGLSAAELELKAAFIGLDERVNALIGNTLVNTLSNIGTSIGEAIASGGNVIDAVGNTILQGLGGFLSNMGKLLIEYGTLAVLKGKLDIAIATSFGPGVIAAGLAAIAVGVLLSAAGSTISGAASNQGNATGGTASSGGSTVRQSVGSGGGGLNGTVVFEISGQKLVGVLNRTLNRNLAIGG